MNYKQSEEYKEKQRVARRERYHRRGRPATDKVCNQCKKRKELSHFEKGTKSHNCNECREENRIRKNKRTAERLRQNKAKKIDIHKTPCIICGWFDFMAGIDFHHVHPAQKSFGIAVNPCKSKEEIAQEVKKCVCLCSNCHRGVHSGDLRLEKYINVEDYHIKQCSARSETSNTT